MKRHYFFILIFIIGSFSCAKNNSHSGYVDENEALLESLSEVNGRQHTYNYDFDLLEFREKVDYYAPISFSEALLSIPSTMRNKIKLLSASDLPFIAQQQANIVTSWNAFNKLVFQVQFSYLENDTGYQTNFKDFFIVSITQYPEDPFADAQSTLELEENLSEGSYQKLILEDTHPMYFKSGTGSWSRMFDYYKFVPEDNLMDKESTGSSQYYAWYDGLIYKIGFNMDVSGIDHEALIRKIILGS